MEISPSYNSRSKTTNDSVSNIIVKSDENDAVGLLHAESPVKQPNSYGHVFTKKSGKNQMTVGFNEKIFHCLFKFPFGFFIV